MKISIITVVLNNKKYIEDCINSVYLQTHRNYEHIIIDGGSVDGTIELLRSLKLKKLKIFTQKDHGIYDAMNNGIAKTTGEIIGILNSDDIFANNKILEKVDNEFSSNDIDFCFGDIKMYNEKFTKIIRYWRAKKYTLRDIKKGLHPPHPTLFIKKNVYKKIGKFRMGYKLAADYELMIRLFLNQLRFSYIPITLVKMRYGGASTRNIFSHLLSNFESYLAWKNNNSKASPLIMIRKPLLKLTQFISVKKILRIK